MASGLARDKEPKSTQSGRREKERGEGGTEMITACILVAGRQLSVKCHSKGRQRDREPDAFTIMSGELC